MQPEGHHLESADFLREIKLQEVYLCGALENAQIFKESPNLRKKVEEQLQQFTQTIQKTPSEQLNDYLEDMDEKIQTLEQGNPQKAEIYKKIYTIALDCQEDES